MHGKGVQTFTARKQKTRVSQSPLPLERSALKLFFALWGISREAPSHFPFTFPLSSIFQGQGTVVGSRAISGNERTESLPSWTYVIVRDTASKSE